MKPNLALYYIIVSFPTLRITCLLQHNTRCKYRILALSTSVSEIMETKPEQKKYPRKRRRARRSLSETSRYLGFYRKEKGISHHASSFQSTTSLVFKNHFVEKINSKVHIPPWIPHFVRSSDGMINSSQDLILTSHAKHSLLKLRIALENHITRIQATGDFFANAATQDVIKDPSDIEEIINAVLMAGAQSARFVSGAAEFLCLLLSIDEVSSQERKISYATYSTDFPTNSNNRLSVVSKHSMIAASFHYVDCVVAREGGVYEIVRETMRGIGPFAPGNNYLPSSSNLESNNVSLNRGSLESTNSTKESNNLVEKFQLSDDVVGILQAAAKIKQVEILADAIKSGTASYAAPSREEAASLRGILLSASEDWRSLMIRCVASLYRLRGVSHQQRLMTSSLSLMTSNIETVRVAREALHVYAPLAQRLGLYRLKNEIQSRCFSILYKRQYRIAQSLFARQGASLESVADFLSDWISQTLMNDIFLSENLECFRIESRVKQPYSLWKKLLRQRMRNTNTNRLSKKIVDRYELSVTDVLDSIALRVILRPKVMDNVDHEKRLCYYALQILQNIFEVTDTKRIKDYLSAPKSNGYMSIHFTSRINRFSQEWPFEVQIRTEDMHHKAEHGPAAHWDYKLRSKDLDDTTSVTSVVTTNLRTSTGSAYVDSFLSSRESIIMNDIFFFVSPTDSALDGKIISMPKNSTVHDALSVTSKMFHFNSTRSQSHEYFLNGIQVDTWKRILNNGDILTFPLLENNTI